MLTSLNTTTEVQRHKTRMAILPVGATEQHSEHLPLVTSGIFPDHDPLMHADEFETSVMLHLKEDAVRKSRIRDRSGEIDREMLRYVSIKKLAKRTHAGHPTRATVEKGRRAMQCMI